MFRWLGNLLRFFAPCDLREAGREYAVRQLDDVGLAPETLLGWCELGEAFDNDQFDAGIRDVLFERGHSTRPGRTL